MSVFLLKCLLKAVSCLLQQKESIAKCIMDLKALSKSAHAAV